MNCRGGCECGRCPPQTPVAETPEAAHARGLAEGEARWRKAGAGDAKAILEGDIIDVYCRRHDGDRASFLAGWRAAHEAIGEASS
jgi:hypothetical protein